MNKSKKIVAIFSLIILLSSIFYRSNAQNPNYFYLEEPKLFQGGVVAGANFCQVDGDNYAGFFKIGFNAGAVLYTRINNSFAVSMELLFSQKGATSNFRKDKIVSQKINLNYAEIPILINVFDKKKSHLSAGLSYARLISSNDEIITNPSGLYDQTKYPFKKYDLNFIAGVNLHLLKGLYGNLRFQYSVLPIRTDIDTRFARDQQYNNMWTLRVMYLF